MRKRLPILSQGGLDRVSRAVRKLESLVRSAREPGVPTNSVLTALVRVSGSLDTSTGEYPGWTVFRNPDPTADAEDLYFDQEQVFVRQLNGEPLCFGRRYEGRVIEVRDDQAVIGVDNTEVVGRKCGFSGPTDDPYCSGGKAVAEYTLTVPRLAADPMFDDYRDLEGAWGLKFAGTSTWRWASFGPWTLTRNSSTWTLTGLGRGGKVATFTAPAAAVSCSTGGTLDFAAADPTWDSGVGSLTVVGTGPVGSCRCGKSFLAKVSTAPTTLAAGQSGSWLEQSETDTGAPATPPDADTGTFLLPTAFGTVANDDLILVFDLPDRDEKLAVPVKPPAAPSVERPKVVEVTDAGASGVALHTVKEKTRNLADGALIDVAGPATHAAYPASDAAAVPAGTLGEFWADPSGTFFWFTPTGYATDGKPGLWLGTDAQDIGATPTFKHGVNVEQGVNTDGGFAFHGVSGVTLTSSEVSPGVGLILAGPGLRLDDGSGGSVRVGTDVPGFGGTGAVMLRRATGPVSGVLYCAPGGGIAVAGGLAVSGVVYTDTGYVVYVDVAHPSVAGQTLLDGSGKAVFASGVYVAGAAGMSGSALPQLGSVQTFTAANTFTGGLTVGATGSLTLAAGATLTLDGTMSGGGQIQTVNIIGRTS